MNGLTHAIMGSWNAEWPEFSIFLADVHAPNREGSTSEINESAQFTSLFWRRIGLSVYSRCTASPVFLCHVPNGQKFGVVAGTDEPLVVAHRFTIVVFDCVGQLSL
jgi:hypothetical protein